MYFYVKSQEIYTIKFNCSNANAAICGDYYLLSIYIVRNKTSIYIKNGSSTHDTQFSVTMVVWLPLHQLYRSSAGASIMYSQAECVPS
jgi:hypothetical protein